MRIVWPVLILICLSPSAWPQAQFVIEPEAGGGMRPPADLLGTWGTPTQCPEKQVENPAAARFSPYHISAGWIRQGEIYCYLSWRGNYADGAGSETHALAQCGEDSLREYRIVLRLEKSRLQIHWSESYSTATLERCD